MKKFVDSRKFHFLSPIFINPYTLNLKNDNSTVSFKIVTIIEKRLENKIFFQLGILNFLTPTLADGLCDEHGPLNRFRRKTVSMNRLHIFRYYLQLHFNTY